MQVRTSGLWKWLNKSHSDIPWEIKMGPVLQVIKNGPGQELCEGSHRLGENWQATLCLNVCSWNLISTGIKSSFHVMLLPFGKHLMSWTQCESSKQVPTAWPCPLKVFHPHFVQRELENKILISKKWNHQFHDDSFLPKRYVCHQEIRKWRSPFQCSFVAHYNQYSIIWFSLEVEGQQKGWYDSCLCPC